MVNWVCFLATSGTAPWSGRSGVVETGCDHDAQRLGGQRNPGRSVGADLPVHVKGQRRVGIQPQLADGEERRLGQRAVGTQEGVANRRADQCAAAVSSVPGGCQPPPSAWISAMMAACRLDISSESVWRAFSAVTCAVTTVV